MKRRLEKLIAKRRKLTGEPYELAKQIVLAQERKRNTQLRFTSRDANANSKRLSR